MEPVPITGREIYELLSALNVKVAVLVEKVDRLGPDHEARIRSLEKARWPLPSVAILVSIAALVVALLVA